MTKKTNSNKKTNIFDVKLFLKDNIIFNKLVSRPDSYYVSKNKKYTSICFIFSFFSFFLITFGHQTIVMKNAKQKTYLTTILGDTFEYEETDKRNKIVNDFLKNYSKKGNQ